MSARPQAPSRDMTALVGILLATPLGLVGLVLPLNDYGGVGPQLENLVDRDSLFVSTLFVIVAFVPAVVAIAAWPSRALRWFAGGVFLLALWNLVNVLSYYWWRNDLVFCHGGCA